MGWKLGKRGKSSGGSKGEAEPKDTTKKAVIPKSLMPFPIEVQAGFVRVPDADFMKELPKIPSVPKGDLPEKPSERKKEERRRAKLTTERDAAKIEQAAYLMNGLVFSDQHVVLPLAYDPQAKFSVKRVPTAQVAEFLEDNDGHHYLFRPGDLELSFAGVPPNVMPAEGDLEARTEIAVEADDQATDVIVNPLDTLRYEAVGAILRDHLELRVLRSNKHFQARVDLGSRSKSYALVMNGRTGKDGEAAKPKAGLVYHPMAAGASRLVDLHAGDYVGVLMGLTSGWEGRLADPKTGPEVLLPYLRVGIVDPKANKDKKK